MAKAARRSVASDPSSPTLSSNLFSINSSSKISATLTDPVRSTSSGIYYTTKAVPKFDRSGTSPRPISSNQFENVNTNTTSSQHHFNNTTSLADSLAAERERVRMEFYATYDVMTGVRIAATLGGFFGLMVVLVMYKSRSHTNQALKDPNIAAVAAAVVQEEEERELQEALEATGLSLYPDDYAYGEFRRQRMLSLGNVSAPPVLHRGFRFSSFGGYSSLLEPQRRYSYGGAKPKYTSESSRILSAYPMGDSFGTDDFIETDGEEIDDEFDQMTTTTAEPGYSHYLSVPPKHYDSRRSSDITCCSTESSYLERRCSAITLGLHSLAPISSRNPSRRPSHDTSEYFYPDINVTQPTPKTSPCPSEGNLPERTKNGRVKRYEHHQQQQQHPSDSFDYISEYPDDDDNNDNDKLHRIEKNSVRRKTEDNNSVGIISNSSHITRRAPLASLSSFKISSVDYQDSDLRSLGSDSVFAESYADTDEDMEQFSTDSDEISDVQSPPRTRSLINRSNIITTCDDVTNDLGESGGGSGGGGGSSGVLCSTISASDIVSSKTNDHHNKKYSSDIIPKSSSVQISYTFETKAIIERPHQNDMKSIRPASYSGCTTSSFSNVNNDNNNSNQKNNNNNNINLNKINSECDEINVIVENNRPTMISSSSSPTTVILELPVISTQVDDDEQPIDPSVPGPSRKWSKETLF